MTTFTHEIIRMERGETSGSKSPMWRCTTKDGQRVNVFQHIDPKKDGSTLFIEAGYFNQMSGLKVGEALEWSQYPIQVVMTSDGKWFEVKAVAPKPEDAEPDVLWQPDLKAYRKRARILANWLISRGDDTFCIDVEMTGLRTDDELVAMAIIDMNGEVRMNELICPMNPNKLWRKQKDGLSAADITGITPEQLMETQNFKAQYPFIRDILDQERWVAYNANFDVRALDQECSNAGVPLLTNAGVFDAAVIAAEYLGNWNEKRQWFEMLKLADAATQLGVMLGAAHTAHADAAATYDILKAIASDVGVSAGVPF
ncbi:MAG: 3'-5' exonuclease [Chloroflexota bacterium]